MVGTFKRLKTNKRFWLENMKGNSTRRLDDIRIDLEEIW